MKITILGAGNGAIAAAAHMTLNGHQVTLSNRSKDRLKPFINDSTVHITGGFLPDTSVKIYKVLPQEQVAVQDAELIMVCVPSVGHVYHAKTIAPVLKPDQVIMLNPGHMGGALQFYKSLRQFGYNGKINICETNTLTYACRMQGERTVGIYNIGTNIFFASLPASNSFCDKVISMYPGLIKRPNVLYTSFSDLNAVIHPPGMLLNAAMIERTSGDFTFYYEGTTPAVAKLIAALDSERLQITKTLGIELDSFLEMFYKWGMVIKEVYERGSIYTAMRESIPNRTIKSPSSLNDRYIHEDVGNGLVPMSLVAKAIGLQTPVMDAFINLAGIINGVDYWTEGLTLEKLGIEAVNSPDELLNYVNNIE